MNRSQSKETIEEKKIDDAISELQCELKKEDERNSSPQPPTTTTTTPRNGEVTTTQRQTVRVTRTESEEKMEEDSRLRNLEALQLSPGIARKRALKSTSLSDSPLEMSPFAKSEELEDGFIEELYKVLDEMSEEQRRHMERVQLEQQQKEQLKRASSKKKPEKQDEDDRRIVIGKYGML
jgi:hypothetical protein